MSDMGSLLVIGKHIHTLDGYIYATFTFNNTQLSERRLRVVFCIYVFTTRIPQASQQGFAAYQAFVYYIHPTNIVTGCNF